MAVSRLITSRYPGRCRKCGNTYRPGERVYWTKGTRGAIHESCQNGSQPSGAPESSSQPKPSKEDAVFTTRFTELAAKFRQATEGKLRLRNDNNQRLLKSFVRRWEINEYDFFGAKTADMLDWLARGYNAGALEGVETVRPVKDRRRIRYAEEGEFQYDLMRSGFDYPFLEWDKRQSIPGMSVDISMEFLCDVSANVVVEYEKWLCRALYSIEAAGVDTEIAVTTYTVGTFYDAPRKKTLFRTVVKDENEAMDWTQWSAILSPGGYRILIFLSLVTGGDEMGHNVAEGLGHNAERESWGVEFDTEKRKLRITTPSSAREFPEALMTQKLREALTQAMK